MRTADRGSTVGLRERRAEKQPPRWRQGTWTYLHVPVNIKHKGPLAKVDHDVVVLLLEAHDRIKLPFYILEGYIFKSDFWHKLLAVNHRRGQNQAYLGNETERISRTQLPPVQREQRVAQPKVDQAANRITRSKLGFIGSTDILAREAVAIVTVVAPRLGFPARRPGQRGLSTGEADGDRGPAKGGGKPASQQSPSQRRGWEPPTSQASYSTQ